MDFLKNEEINTAQNQTLPAEIDGIGVDIDPMGNGVRLVLRKAANGGFKMYYADSKSMLDALRSAVEKLESSI